MLTRISAIAASPWHPVRVGLGGVRVLALALVLAVATACSSSLEDDDEELAARIADLPVEDLYARALRALEVEDYEVAASRFEEVERLHPYSVWATKAQLMSAYSYYQEDNYDEAVIALDRFITLHPGHKDIAYAHYLKGLSFYEQISDPVRDQKMTEEAKKTFEEITKRFPDSKYAKDAVLKIDVAKDNLAAQSMHVGRYYQKRGEHLAAINRFRAVIEQYQTTVHVPEALHRTVESYLALGIVDEARIAGAVLGYNYPGSSWYINAFELLKKNGVTPADEPELRVAAAREDRGSWLSDALDWLLP